MAIKNWLPFHPAPTRDPPQKWLIDAKYHTSVILIASTGLKQICKGLQHLLDISGMISLPYNGCRWGNDVMLVSKCWVQASH